MTATRTPHHRVPGELAKLRADRERRRHDRTELAGHALAGMLANPETIKGYDKTPAAALTFADRLLEEIERSEGKEAGR
jgi:hypothetical protein